MRLVEYTFVYTDPETREVHSADSFRAQINEAIIRDAKLIFRNAKSILARKFRIKYNGQRDIAILETPKDITQANWKKAIDMFELEDFKVIFFLNNLLTSISSD